jgi:trimethylamine--corrinoid protein Co-methyltransferase
MEQEPVPLRVLSAGDVNRIHEATLKVLEKTGVWFKDCPEAQELFAENGCRIEDGRVLFPPELLAEVLTRVPDRNTLVPFFPCMGYVQPLSVRQGETHFGLIGNAYYIHDYEARASRNCLESDVADKLLVLDSLPNFEYDCCNLFTASERGIGTPVVGSYNTLDACIRFLRQWVCARAVPGRKRLPLGNLNCCPEESRLAVLGHAILEGPAASDQLLNDGNFFPWVNPQSPLQYKAGEARAMIEAARSDRGWNQVSPEVMMGGTGPVTMAGALVQHNAEVLAGLILAESARPGSPFIYGCVSAPMDLRNAEISQGSLETSLFNAAVVQIADHYGLPTRISPGNTSDRKPGARALAETAVGLYMGAAAGGNLITTGLLDSTLMISYEHLVMVDELIHQIRSITGGIATDADSLALEAIGQCGHPGGDYLASGHTMQFMKRDVYYSDFCGRIRASYEDSYEKAHQRVRDILARRHTDAHVEKDVLARLAAVEARLKEDDETWRKGRGDWWAPYLEDRT